MSLLIFVHVMYVHGSRILGAGDGKKLGLESDKLKIDNILDLINKHARKLEEIEQANNW